MKLLQRKNALSTVLLSCTLLFTITASAQEATLTESLAATLQVQGQKAQHDLSTALSYSIKAELERFSMRYSTDKTQEIVALSAAKKLTPAKQQTSKY